MKEQINAEEKICYCRCHAPKNRRNLKEGQCQLCGCLSPEYELQQLKAMNQMKEQVSAEHTNCSCPNCVPGKMYQLPQQEQVSVDKEEYIKLLRFRTECDFLYKKINYKINELKKEDYLNDSRETQEKISLLESLFK